MNYNDYTTYMMNYDYEPWRWNTMGSAMDQKFPPSTRTTTTRKTKDCPNMNISFFLRTTDGWAPEFGKDTTRKDWRFTMALWNYIFFVIYCFFFKFFLKIANWIFLNITFGIHFQIIRVLKDDLSPSLLEKRQNTSNGWCKGTTWLTP